MTSTTGRSDLDLTGITTVEVATFGGELSIVTGADHPRMEADAYGNASWTVERVGSLLYIVGKKRGFFYLGNGVSFRLWLPAHLALKLANVNGDIRMRGDVRSLSAHVVHGGIELRASNLAEADLQAVHGRVKVNGVTGKLKIATVPGEVRVSNSGGELQITATPGNVLLEQVVLAPGVSHTITTGPGDIALSGIHAPGGLILRGKATTAPIIAEFPPDEMRNKGTSLKVERPGPNPATLILHAVGKLSVKQ
ncbi:MAG TPA: DUF4097 family beta strand repeat-containing protein [Ktedonobacterales bacterium]